MRPVYFIALIILAVGLAVGGGLAWNAALWRMGWFKGPPEMAKTLANISGNTGWQRRLRETFPIGSQERVMVESLTAQGFEVSPEDRRAAYGWAKYPCVYTLTVNWRADETRRIRVLQGVYHTACTDPARLPPEPQRRFQPRQTPPSRSLVAPAQSA